jgi:energy-coupling factor transporter transmembrane protein EcfT
LGRRGLTPYSQIFSIPIFIAAVLVDRNPFILFLQAIFLVLSIPVFRLEIRGIRWRQVLHLVPILLFVIVFNAFRGGGEIILRAGPVLVMRQGMYRGIYFSAFIVELWIMSALLTRSFPEHELLGTFHAMSFQRRGRRDRSDGGGIALLLYFILRLFHSTYSELRTFFERGSPTLKERTLRFISAAFRHAEMRYVELGSVEPQTLKPRPSDYLYAGLQASTVLAALGLRILLTG